MKLSIAFFAAVSAVSDDFELPEICEDLAGQPGFEGLKNCWFSYPRGSEFDNGTLVEPSAGYGDCGFQVKGGSMTNATCDFFSPTTVNGADFMIGNAAFVAKGSYDYNKIVGLDMSGDLNIIQSWNVAQVDADKVIADEKAFYANKEAILAIPENYTGEEDFDFVAGALEACNYDEISFTPPQCVPNPDGYYPEYAIMITNQHAGDDNNNYAIANYGGKDNVFTVTLNTPCTGATPHDANQAEIAFITNEDYQVCRFVVKVLKGQAQLFYFTISGADDIVNFFDVDIA